MNFSTQKSKLAAVLATTSFVLVVSTSSVGFASSCTDSAAAEKAGLEVVLKQAQGNLPGVQTQYSISNVKFNAVSGAGHFWDPDQLDSYSFDVVVGVPTPGQRFAYQPAVAYSVIVAIDCSVTTQLDYEIQN